jgi:DNA-binding transcriptional MocR family regulator
MVKDLQYGLTTTPGHWVQVERKAMEQWAKLTLANPKAAAVMHLLLANVGRHNAVVISQKTMAGLLGCSVRTVIRAVEILQDHNWVEVRRIGSTNTTNAYIINDRVAWVGARDGLRHSMFSATVIVSEEEQPDKGTLNHDEQLKQIPFMNPDEQQIPSGPGLEPPSEPPLTGLEPDLPARKM